MRVLFVICLFSAAVLAGCGDRNSTCSSDGDCPAGHACLQNGGVLFGARLCIDVRTIGSGDMPDADAGRTDARQDGCVPRALDCEGRCGELVGDDGCGAEIVLQCGGCESPAVCGFDEPNVCGCDPASYCKAVGQQCGLASAEACPRQVIDCGDCGIGVCDEGTLRCDCGVGAVWATEGEGACVCDEDDDYYGDPADRCLRPPEVGGIVSATGTDQIEFMDVPTNAAGASLYVLAVASNVPVVSVDGLGLVWSQLAEQCSEFGDSYVSVWGAGGAAEDGTVTVELDGAGLGLGLITSFTGVDIFGESEVLTGNSVADGSCTDGDQGGSEDLSVPTRHASSVVLLAVGGVIATASLELSPEARLLGSIEAGTLALHMVVYDAPVDTPSQRVAFSVGDDDHAFVVGEVPAAEQ